mgnify:CR=1 FL=1
MKSVILFSIVSNLLLLVIPIYTIVVYDKILMASSYNTLIWISFIAVIALTIYGLLESLKTTIIRREAIANEKNTLDSVAENLDILAQNNAANLEEIQADIKSITSYEYNIRSLGYDIPWAFIFLFLMYLLHPYLFLVVLIISLIVVTISLSKQPPQGKVLDFDRLFQFLLKKPSHVFNFDSKNHLSEVLDTAFKKDIKSRTDIGFQENLLTSISKTLKVSSSVFIIATGAFLVIQQEISAGSMIAASMITSRILSPIEHIGVYFRNRKKYMVTHSKIKKMLGAIKKFNNSDEQVKIQDTSIKASNIKYFSQTGEPVMAINNLDIQGNKIIAISGGSGSGKTTLLKILSGIINPQSGSIQLGQIDLKKIDKNDLIFVESKHSLFPGTIKENLTGFSKNIDMNNFSNTLIDHFKIKKDIFKLPKNINTQVEDIPKFMFTSGFHAAFKLIYAFCNNKKIRVIDDVEQGLDFDGLAEFKKLAVTSKNNGGSILFVCHHKNLLDIADILIIVNNGAISKVVNLEAEREKNEQIS